MVTVTVLALLVSFSIMVIPIAKIAAFLGGIGRKLPRKHWTHVLDRALPSWRMFGQNGGSYDLYVVVGDRLPQDELHFHLHDGISRRWFHPLFNPHSRCRFLERRTVQTVLDHHLREDVTAPSNVAMTEILTETVRSQVRSWHPDDAHLRTAMIYIVFDRGHVSVRPPEAKVEIGPVGVSKA